MDLDNTTKALVTINQTLVGNILTANILWGLKILKWCDRFAL